MQDGGQDDTFLEGGNGRRRPGIEEPASGGMNDSGVLVRPSEGVVVKHLVFFLGLLLVFSVCSILLAKSPQFEGLIQVSVLCVFFLFYSVYLLLCRVYIHFYSYFSKATLVLVNTLVLYFIIAELKSSDSLLPNDLFISSIYILYWKLLIVPKRFYIVNCFLLSSLNLALALRLTYYILPYKTLPFLIVSLLAFEFEQLPGNNRRKYSVASLGQDLNASAVQDHTNMDHSLRTCDFITETLKKTYKSARNQAERRRIRGSLTEMAKIKYQLVHGTYVDYVPELEMGEEDKVFCAQQYTSRSPFQSREPTRKRSLKQTLYEAMQKPTPDSLKLSLSHDLEHLLSTIGKMWNFDV